MAKTKSQGARWWVAPLIMFAVLASAATAAWQVSETAREVLAKAVFLIAGAVSTPFILEASVALLGLVALLAINQWRLEREGDGWVIMATNDPEVAPEPASLAHRLEPSLSDGEPGASPEAAIDARLAVIEGYLELGLAREAIEELDGLTLGEQATARAQAARLAAKAMLK